MSNTRSNRASLAIALTVDVVIVVLFAIVGRMSHGMQVDLASFAAVAWPFLAGLAITWLAALVWRDPYAPLRSGVPVWIGTLVIGMLLRYVPSERVVSWSFIIVAAAFFAVLFIGWRDIAALIRRRRAA